MALNLSAEQTSHLLARVLTLPQQDDALVLESFIRLGIRTDEALRITKDSILPLGVYITASKGSDNHIVPISSAYQTRLTAYLRRYPFLGSHVTTSSQPNSVKAILRRLFARYRRRLGLPPQSSLHSLRSGFVALIYESTRDIMLAKSLVGHRRIESTMSYTRALDLTSRRSDILKAIG